MTNPGYLTEAEQNDLARLLEKQSQHPEQRVNTRLFLAARRMTTSLSAEVAILRQVDGRTEVYMTQREATDPYYANEWHVPGSVLLHNEPMDKAAERLLREEVGLTAKPERQRVFEWPKGDRPGQCARGHAICFYHTLWVDEEQEAQLSGGQFFDLRDLPEQTIELHSRMLSWLSKAIERGTIITPEPDYLTLDR